MSHNLSSIGPRALPRADLQSKQAVLSVQRVQSLRHFLISVMAACFLSILPTVHSAPPAMPGDDHKPNPSPEATENWCSYDSNGNVVLLTDAEARPTARYEYDAFGKTIAATGPAAEGNRYRFSTKPVEVYNGLAFYGFRYCSLDSGRWPSKDPIGVKGGINIYAMCGNNGVGQIDVLGLRVPGEFEYPEDRPTYAQCNKVDCELSYLLNDDENWWSMGAYPSGTTTIPPGPDQMANLLNTFRNDVARKNCKCVKKIYFTQHGGDPGTLLIANGSVSEAMLQAINSEIDAGRAAVRRRVIARETEFMTAVAGKMCSGGSVVFAQCSVTNDPEGSELTKWLASILGPDVDVTLFSSGFQWRSGQPTCVTHE